MNTDSQILLFQTVQSVSDDWADLFRELEQVTGMHEADIRFRLSGQGIGMFPVIASSHDAEKAVITMHGFGIRAVYAPQRSDRVRKPLPIAKFLSATPLYLIFKDEKHNPLLATDRTSDILIVLADLSGVFRDTAISEMAYKGAKYVPFRHVLNKAAPFVFQPVADIFLLNADAPNRGVRIDSRNISFAGPVHPGGKKFPDVIRHVMAHARNCLTDHYFGLAGLPGAKPDRQSYKEDSQGVARMLARYEHYVLTAANHGLILPEQSAEINGHPSAAPIPNSYAPNPSPSEIRQIFIPETGMPDETHRRLMPIIMWGFITICAAALPFIFFRKRTGMFPIYLTGGVIIGVSLIFAGIVLSFHILKRLGKHQNEDADQEFYDSGSPEPKSGILPLWVMRLLVIGGLCITGCGVLILIRLRIWQFF